MYSTLNFRATLRDHASLRPEPPFSTAPIGEIPTFSITINQPPVPNVFETDHMSGAWPLVWDGYDAFVKWKKNEEARLNIDFIRQYLRKNFDGTVYERWVCHCGSSGGPRPAPKVRKRGHRKLPSKRCQCPCILHIKTYPNSTTSQVHGQYQDQHNHPLRATNARFTRIPEETVEAIKGMCRRGVQLDKIVRHSFRAIPGAANILNSSRPFTLAPIMIPTILGRMIPIGRSAGMSSSSMRTFAESRRCSRRRQGSWTRTMDDQWRS
jgi:hypothetical protein